MQAIGAGMRVLNTSQNKYNKKNIFSLEEGGSICGMVCWISH